VQISPDGIKVIIESRKKPGAYVHEYRFDKGLPSKLLPWYKYAADFVNVVRSKTPQIIFEDPLLACALMIGGKQGKQVAEITFKGQQEVRVAYGLDTQKMNLEVDSKGYI